MRFALALVLLAGCIDLGGPSEEPPEPTSRPAPVERFEARVTRITDGDTIVVELDGRQERVRYIGIDTPETSNSPRGPEPFAEEATRANREWVEDQVVQLELDTETRDRFGRLLAYVFLSDGTFVNARLLEEGYARTLTIPPNVRYADEFRTLESDARTNARGLWAR
ncbi:MAG: thermonuclease family protein [Myxococcota bacterium]